MHFSFVRSLAAGGALALAALAWAAPAQGQALHPLPAAFLATLKDIDTSADEMAAAVTAIKDADLTYALFSRRRVKEAIEGMEKQLPVLRTQTAGLRREESLGMLLSARTNFSEARRNVGSISDILHGLTVRTPAEASQLDKLLERLDGAIARLDARLRQFDSGAMALTALASATPARGPAHASAAPAQSSASAASAQASASSAPAPLQTRPSLPPEFLATLGRIDASTDEMAASVTAIKQADLTYALFSRRRVKEAIEQMEKQLPVLKTQTADLRREESVGMLLSARTNFSEARRNVGSISDILHGLTVRTPAEADQLDKLLARLDGAIARLDIALKQFDSGAMALLDRRPAAQP